MNTQDYRHAPSNIGPQAATWKDKPHRLVYDLCSEVERLQQKLEIAELNQDRLGKLHRGEGDYPKLLTHKDKHGHLHILVMDEGEEGAAWLGMFQVIDRLGYYSQLAGDEVEAYAQARQGNWQGAKWLLCLRDHYEYEDVTIECIDTPYSLKKHHDNDQQS